MRVYPVFLAIAMALASPSLGGEAVILQAPPGDTVIGIAKATMLALRDTIDLDLPAVASVPEDGTFLVTLAKDGWYQVEFEGRRLWTPQRGVRVTTASMYHKEQALDQERAKTRNSVLLGALGLVVLMILVVSFRLRSRRLQEVRRKWVLLATRYEGLGESLVKEGWDVQTLPTDTRMGDFLPHVRPTVVIADQTHHSADVGALESNNASVASTPILWLNATVISRAQDPSRAYLPPGTKIAAILEVVQRLSVVVPGPEQLSRRADIEGKLGQGRLLELLHFLATARRTGRVEVRVGTESAWMWFEDGHLRHGLAGSRSGVDAVYYCLDMTRGSFSFRAGVTPPEKSIRENTLTMLHEYARQHDEHAQIPRH